MALPAYLNKLSVLKQIPIFADLNWFELNRIARRAELVEYNKGNVICKQGSPADAFYALVTGRIYSYALTLTGDREEVDFILRGMHFGIISALTGEDHSHFYEAINDSVVLKINKDDFAQLLKVTPKLAVALSQSLSKRIRSHVTHTRNTKESAIISIYASMKGSGSSTYAANIAMALNSETNKKVLLISLSSDAQSPLTNLADIVSDNDRLLSHIIKGRSSIDILCAKFDSGNAALINKISQFVSAPANDYHFVVIDLPNEMDDVVMKTLTQSDIIHLVAMDRPKDLEMTRHVIDRLTENLKENFRAENVQVVISGVEVNGILSPDEIKKILNYDVFLVLPHLYTREFTNMHIIDGFSFIAGDPLSEYGFTIRRLAREISGSLVGLVLGGGAALGLAHIGVIKVLEREKIPIDIIVGSSMGALVGSIWAAGNKHEYLEACAREFQSKAAMLKVFDPIIPISGLVGGEGIRQWLKSKLSNKTFHHTKIPLKIIAYDLYHRQEIVIDSGFLVDAVRKSVGIPGVMRPVMEDDKMIIDGGVLNPLPTNVLVNMGVKKIIAVNVLQSPQEVSWGHNQLNERLYQRSRISFSQHPFKFIGFRIEQFFARIFTPNISDIIVRTLQSTEYLIAEQSARQADILIHPDLKGINWFELYEVENLLKRGEEAAMQHLPAIKELIKK